METPRLVHNPLLLVIVAATVTCGEPDRIPEDTDEEPLEHLFSFAIFADPHVVTSGDHLDRLEAAVAWTNANADARRIDVVFVVGDVGWSGGLPLARAALDGLDVPYVPVIGDNEIQTGDEKVYDDVFGPHYATLETRLADWRRAAALVWNPEHETQSWLQNWSFTHQGVRFVGLDWCSRTIGGLLGEMADLHDFEGGTLPFFAADLVEETGADESVVWLSHHPMYASPGAFDGTEMGAITALTEPLAHRVAANYAGHYHLDLEETPDDAGYDVFVTDALWDDVVRVRVVEVWGNGARFEYVQDLVDIP
jgi:hypothetical protein